VIISSMDIIPVEIINRYNNKVKFITSNIDKVKSILNWVAIISKYKPNSVIFMETWFIDYGLVSVFAAWLLTKGSVYMTEHSDIDSIEKSKMRLGIIPSFGFWKYPLTMRALLCKKILAVSQGLKNKLVKYYNYPKNKIEVAYFPLDNRLYAPLNIPNNIIRTKYGISYNDIVVIVAARLVKEKGIDLIIEAFGKLKEMTKRDDIWLWIVGNGENEFELKEMAINKGIAGRVIFLGYQKNVEDYLREANIYISASKIESFGIALLEAMSVGLVCIATSTCGSMEIMADKRFIVNYDPNEIYSKLDNILKMNKSEIKLMKQNNREYVVNKYNKSEEIDKALKILGIPITYE